MAVKEVIVGKFIKIKPLEYKGFVSEDKTWEQVGEVVAKNDKKTGFLWWRKEVVPIPLGSKVWFDSFMARKYPVPNTENQFEWFVPLDEIVKYEIDAPE